MRAVETLANSDVVQKTGELAGPAIGVAHDALREAAKKTSEIVHGATRAMTAAGRITAKGIPEIKGIQEHVEAIETSADDLAESTKEVFDTLREKAPDVLDAVDPSGAVEEAVEACVEQAGETMVELVGEVAAEEVAESVAEVIPGVGIIVPSYHLIHGAGKATAGISSLVTGGIMALVGGVYGAAAAPFDGGAAWGKVMNVSRKPSAWGASMSAEGGLIAAKGAMGYANQVCCLHNDFLPRRLFRNVVACIPPPPDRSRHLDVRGWLKSLLDLFFRTRSRGPNSPPSRPRSRARSARRGSIGYAIRGNLS